MSGFNRSPKAFSDVADLLERAINSEKGVRIPLSSRSAAITLRARANYYRKLDRVRNKDIYPMRDHPMHGNSTYDALVLRIPPKGSPEEHVLYVEPHTLVDLVIEDIK